MHEHRIWSQMIINHWLMHCQKWSMKLKKSEYHIYLQFFWLIMLSFKFSWECLRITLIWVRMSFCQLMWKFSHDKHCHDIMLKSRDNLLQWKHDKLKEETRTLKKQYADWNARKNRIKNILMKIILFMKRRSCEWLQQKMSKSNKREFATLKMKFSKSRK